MDRPPESRVAPPLEQVVEAMGYLSPEDRSTWISVGMAVNDAYGEPAYEPWAAWSARSSKWNARVGRGQWRSFKPGRGLGLGTLFKLARDAGWRPRDREPEPPAERAARERRQRFEAERAARELERQRVEAKRRADRAALEAQAMLSDSIDAPHPYLDAKFPRVERVAGEDAWTTGLVDKSFVRNGRLLIPMLHPLTGAVRAVQEIAADGSRKFQPFGVQTRGLVHRLGLRHGAAQHWACEGYATGLAALMALWARGRREDQVVVVFAASQFRYLRAQHPRAIVIADNDPDGLRYAEASKLRVVVPGGPGEDAWDVWHREGPAELGWRLLQARMKKAGGASPAGL